MLITLQNVLIASPKPIWVKIADFGGSKRTKGTMLYTRIGTQGYVAPELLGLLTPGANTSGYSNSVDMWSLGCVVYELLTAEIPFLEAGRPESFMSGLDTEYADEMPQQDLSALKAFCDGKSDFPTDVLRLSGASDRAVEFVTSLLVPSPGSRAAAEAALQSQWLLQDENPASRTTKLPVELSGANISISQVAAKVAFTSESLSVEDDPVSQTIGLTVEPSAANIATPQTPVRASHDSSSETNGGLYVFFPLIIRVQRQPRCYDMVFTMSD